MTRTKSSPRYTLVAPATGSDEAGPVIVEIDILDPAQCELPLAALVNGRSSEDVRGLLFKAPGARGDARAFAMALSEIVPRIEEALMEWTGGGLVQEEGYPRCMVEISADPGRNDAVLRCLGSDCASAIDAFVVPRTAQGEPDAMALHGVEMFCEEWDRTVEVYVRDGHFLRPA